MKPTRHALNGRENYLTLKTLIQAMKGWSIRFKDRQPDEAEMTYLAKEYFRDLTEERVTEHEFIHADRHVCKENRFFPVMADLVGSVRVYRDSKHSMERARAKWLIDNAWRVNSPEGLSTEDRIDLGVTVGAMQTALEWGGVSQLEFDCFVAAKKQKEIGHTVPPRNERTQTR